MRGVGHGVHAHGFPPPVGVVGAAAPSESPGAVAFKLSAIPAAFRSADEG